MTVKHRQLAPTVGPISNDPSTNPMATFNFSTAMPEEATTFIFGSWICVDNGQGGFHSHLADTLEPKIDQLGIPDSATELADNLNKIQFFYLLEERSSNDQENIQPETFLIHKKLQMICSA